MKSLNLINIIILLITLSNGIEKKQNNSSKLSYLPLELLTEISNNFNIDELLNKNFNKNWRNTALKILLNNNINLIKQQIKKNKLNNKQLDKLFYILCYYDNTTINSNNNKELIQLIFNKRIIKKSTEFQTTLTNIPEYFQNDLLLKLYPNGLKIAPTSMRAVLNKNKLKTLK